MAYYLPSNSMRDGSDSEPAGTRASSAVEDMADLKVFWGPEICRLEYLLHLLETGRVKDETGRHSLLDRT